MKAIILFYFLLLSMPFSAQCDPDSISPLNKAIVELASSKLNKKVGSGECWDLAKYVLDEVGAKWDGLYVYGRLLEKSECIMAGDIIQFEKVKVKYKVGNQTFTESMQHHTAIILETKSQDELVLIHQNTEYSGRKVGTSNLRLSTIISGKYYIYRPVK